MKKYNMDACGKPWTVREKLLWKDVNVLIVKWE